ncbi:MAG: hypothetical protein HFE75_11535 [Firmicutes bacterium]|jgi:hypothetical protein|nr:hypothetical protein [Bacillota bacterium]
MLARKCDRCGIHYGIDEAAEIGKEKTKINRIGLKGVSENGNILGGYIFDLCPDCVCELVDWIKEGGMNEDM